MPFCNFFLLSPPSHLKLFASMLWHCKLSGFPAIQRVSFRSHLCERELSHAASATLFNSWVRSALSRGLPIRTMGLPSYTHLIRCVQINVYYVSYTHIGSLHLSGAFALLYFSVKRRLYLHPVRMPTTSRRLSLLPIPG